MAEKKKQTKASKPKQLKSRQKTLLELFSATQGQPEADINASNGSSPASIPPEEEDAKSAASLGPPPVSALHIPSMQSGSNGLQSTEQQFLTVDSPTDDRDSRPLQQEVIVILDDETLVSVTDSPMASQSTATLSQASVRRDGYSRDDPIVLDSSPVMPTFPRTVLQSNRKPTYSIFASRPQRQAKDPLRLKKSKLLDACFPTEASQHVRGPQTLFPCPSIPFKTRSQKAIRADETLVKSTLRLNKDPPDPPAAVSLNTSEACLNVEDYIATIPEDHIRLYPAIDRLLRPLPASGTNSQKAWTDRWRPNRAEEVLGNEHHAVYLRSWLSALEIQFESSVPQPPEDVVPKSKSKKKGKGKTETPKKRPRVVRAVDKKRKRQRLMSEDYDDSWIVDSDDSGAEDVFDGYGDDADFNPQPAVDPSLEAAPPDTVKSSIYVVPDLEHEFSRHLTNTILLSGPSGCGKTAAVYACAEELGWEVFEVYPGIGKRSGTNLDNLIGDVGKNHLVRKTQTRDEGPSETSKAKDAFSRLLGKGNGNAGSAPNGPSHGKMPVESDEGNTSQLMPTSHDFGFMSESDSSDAPNALPATPKVRQSLVLLEEVDILFKEDTNFWPALTNFIKESKRPVICTCNDITLVPVQDLPLQSVLNFDPCPTAIAASYLQGLSWAEGHPVARDIVILLYEGSGNQRSDDLSIQPTSHDLRRAIHNLQLWSPVFSRAGRAVENAVWDSSHSLASHWDEIEDSGWPSTGVYNSVEECKLNDEDMRHAELYSFTDSKIVGILSDAQMWYREPSADDEIGHAIFCSPGEAEAPSYRELMAAAATRLSRGRLGVGNGRASRVPLPRGARMAYQRLMAEVLGVAMPTLTTWLDYGPWVRAIVAADDAAAASETRPRTGRTTRNSQGEYVRTVEISEAQRELLASTALGD